MALITFHNGSVTCTRMTHQAKGYKVKLIKYILSSKIHCTSFDHETMHSRLPIGFTISLRGGWGLVCT